LIAVFDAFWRALALLLHPRVLGWSLLPLVLMGGVLAVLGYFWWADAVDAVRAGMERFDLIQSAFQWLERVGGNSLRALLAPIIVVALAIPLVVVLTLVAVGALLTPAVVELVAQRRFAALERKRGASWLQSLGWSLACTAAALAALVASVPLWLIPPLALVLPPLIWGWLTYRVFAFDVLAEHASAEERRQILHARRWPMFFMGVASGIAGAAPALVWAIGAAALILAPLFIVVSVWLYTMVFAFAALWFANYALAQLESLRRATSGPSSASPAALPPAPAPAPAPALAQGPSA
jgi:hypothetical protein